jgi:hypothetical protein
MNSENDAELLFLSLQFLYVMQVQSKLWFNRRVTF